MFDTPSKHLPTDTVKRSGEADRELQGCAMQPSRRERILLTGDLPSPINPPTGCVFHTRCPKYREILGEADKQLCRDVVPLLELKGDDHFVACHFPIGDS